MRVLLTHGLARTSWSMRRLGGALERAGHRAVYAGYNARTESVVAIESRLRATVAELRDDGPLALIGHSLGGLFLRRAAAELELPAPNVVILLATPNQKPAMAERAIRWPPFRWWTGEAGEALASYEAFARIPPLSCRVRVIAGDRGLPATLGVFGARPNDGIITVDEAALPGHGVDLCVHATHTFIMNDPGVRRYVVAEVGKAERDALAGDRGRGVT